MPGEKSGDHQKKYMGVARSDSFFLQCYTIFTIFYKIHQKKYTGVARQGTSILSSFFSFFEFDKRSMISTTSRVQVAWRNFSSPTSWHHSGALVTKVLSAFSHFSQVWKNKSKNVFLWCSWLFKSRNERGAAKLYFTGSAEFNRSMRQVFYFHF